jgi:hypothetical protein
MERLKIEIKWALIFTVVFIAWTTLEKVLGLHDENIKNQILFSYFFAIPMIIVYIAEHTEKKIKTYNGNINWSQGFISGCYMSLFICILNPISQYICFEFISPNYFKNAIDYVVSSKMMAAENATNYFSLKSYIIQGAFSGISSGIIMAAIMAYFLQTKTKKSKNV